MRVRGYKSTAARLRDRQDGFTLIELMVVLLILAILIAMAIPTFLAARQRAQERATQVQLRNALVAAETYYTDTESYDATATDLDAISPDMVFSDLVADADTDTVALVSSADDILFIHQSETDEFFCIAKSEQSPGTQYGRGAAATDVDTLAECSGSSW